MYKNDFDPVIQAQVIKCCEEIYGMKQKGKYLTGGTCPNCNTKGSLFTSVDRPYVIRCKHRNKCGWSHCVMKLDDFSEIFNYSIIKRYPIKKNDLKRPATAFLRYRRGFSEEIVKDLDYEYGAETTGNLAKIKIIKFKLANKDYWGKMVDNPDKRKDDSTFIGTYKNSYWVPNKQQINKGDVVFITEGIFKAIGLLHLNLDDPDNKIKLNYEVKVVSAMNCSNLPMDLINANKDNDITWILAYDNDKAGKAEIPKHYNKLTALNQKVLIALTKTSFADWDDELMHGTLNPQYINNALWRGRCFNAKGPKENAFWIYLKNNNLNEVFDCGNCTWYSTIDSKKLNDMNKDFKLIVPNCNAESKDDELKKSYENYWTDTNKIDEWINGYEIFKTYSNLINICNCTFKFLHIYRDPLTEQQYYVFRAKFNSNSPTQQIQITGKGLTTGLNFKEQLMNHNQGGANFTGSTKALEIMVYKWMRQIPKVVKSVPFIGYDKKSKIYVFPEFGFAHGQKLVPDEQGILEFNGHYLKTSLTRTDTTFITSDKFYGTWFNNFYEVTGNNGIISLGWIIGCLFFNQIIKCHGSFPFLELTGEQGSGKSMLLRHLFKCLGRDNWEGFNPTSSTWVGTMRNLNQMSNLPSSIIESEHENGKSFDFSQLLTAYNGGIIRSRGVANGGAQTIDDYYNGGIIISQNAEIEGFPQLLARIIRCNFTKDHHTKKSIAIAQKLESIPVKDLCGFLQNIIVNEAELFSKFIIYDKEVTEYYCRIVAEQNINIDYRQVKNHAQIGALVRLLPIVFPQCTEELALAVVDELFNMCLKRQDVINLELPILITFFEIYEYLNSLDNKDINCVNNSMDKKFIAINMPQFYRAAVHQGQSMPQMNEVRKAFKSSVKYKFIKRESIESAIDGKRRKCYIFQKPLIHKNIEDFDSLDKLN